MLIIGHRGASGLAKENTISSFKKAEELGVDMIELDLRKKKDGKIIALHGKLNRVTKETPTMDDVLAAVRIPLNLEIKETGFEKEVLAAIKHFSSEVLISSKHVNVLKKIRALDEKVKLALVLGRANFFLLGTLKKLDQKLNLYSIHPKTFLLTKKVFRFLKGLQKKVFVWTVNKPAQFKKYKEMGVDGVFTDYPNLIKK